MNQLYYFIELTRLKRPIGYLLLFWPCIWGLVLGYDFSNDIKNFIKLGLFFLIGAILMRSAGCIVNDIVDRDLDKDVERTKNRPIASGKVSVKLASFYSALLCILAFFILIQFNFFTIVIAMLSMPLAFAYPFMKRLTYWPQLFLGITFNYGLILGWTATNTEISIIPIIFYIGAIFWTLGYDTIYGFQDIRDDEIIGVKSTSIKFKKNPKFFISLCYSIFCLCLLLTGFMMNLNSLFYVFIIIILLHLFVYQIKSLNINSSIKCLSIFKSNNFIGMLVFIGLLFGKII